MGNPFFFSGMVQRPEDFYGRKAELQRIFGLLGGAQPMSVSVVGARRIGKSSLLWYICQKGPERLGKEWRFGYVGLDGLGDLTVPRLLRAMAAAMVGIQALPSLSEEEEGKRLTGSSGAVGSQVKTTAKIFLCYARPDRSKVEDIYQKLSSAGFIPWMDRKDILPGEQWEVSIQKAVRRSDFFLACLSANSVDRRGYLQKEIKDALDIWQEKLDSDIYLIPVRMEDCEIPESLRRFQWANLFEEDGWTKLVKAIQVGMASQGKLPEQLLAMKERLSRDSYEGFSALVDGLVRQGQRLVLCLDKFEAAGQLRSDFLAYLRGLVSTNRATLIIATERPLDELSLEGILTSPFYNLFTMVPLGPMPEDEARDLLTQRGRLSFSDSEAEIAAALRKAQGHPFMLQQLGYQLYEKHYGRASTPLEPIRRTPPQARRFPFSSVRQVLSTPALEWVTIGYGLAFFFSLLAGFLPSPWRSVGYAISIPLALVASLILLLYMISRRSSKWIG